MVDYGVVERIKLKSNEYKHHSTGRILVKSHHTVIRLAIHHFIHGKGLKSGETLDDDDIVSAKLQSFGNGEESSNSDDF